MNYKGLSKKEYNAIIEAYVLSCIKDSERLLSENFIKADTDKERVNAVMAEFETLANYPHNLKNFPNIADRLSDWLQGLPGIFEVAFNNSDIVNLAIEWGVLHEKSTDSQDWKIISGWFNYMANAFLKLHKKLNK